MGWLQWPQTNGGESSDTSMRMPTKKGGGVERNHQICSEYAYLGKKRVELVKLETSWFFLTLAGYPGD